MTQCTGERVVFSSMGRQKVEADFTGGRLSSDTGVLLLREMDRKLGLIDAFNACIPDPRDPVLITHPQRDLLAQRIFAIAQGYEDLNDHDALREDPAVQLATNRPLLNKTKAEFRRVRRGKTYKLPMPPNASPPAHPVEGDYREKRRP